MSPDEMDTVQSHESKRERRKFLLQVEDTFPFCHAASEPPRPPHWLHIGALVMSNYDTRDTEAVSGQSALSTFKKAGFGMYLAREECERVDTDDSSNSSGKEETCNACRTGNVGDLMASSPSEPTFLQMQNLVAIGLSFQKVSRVIAISAWSLWTHASASRARHGKW